MATIDPHDYTAAVHSGLKVDPTHRAIAPVLVTSSTYKQSAPGEHQGYDYSRADNPTREQLEGALATLEGATYGLCFASGLAAIHAVMGLFKPQAHIIVCDDVYGGTRRLFDQIWRPLGCTFEYLDLREPAQLRHALQQVPTAAIWIETPTNPTLRIVDIAACSQLAHEHKAMIIVDNTFATPLLQQPLALGAHLVVHSSTKYLSGHTDVIGGAIMTSHEHLFERLKFLQLAAGAIPSPFDCYLLLRSIPTLALRMERHSTNALQVAQFLDQHPQVGKVLFPGLPQHPQHQLACQQMSDFSGIVSFYLKPELTDLKKFCTATKLFILAESLGSTKSLLNHPATMTHASVATEQRQALGITKDLIRLSVGIEYAQDLCDDLAAAFAAARLQP